ncbi:sclerostin domain-containing protein 1 [Gracilinanus agilis]|uniref:sclerostin domain-containing protein 1 n=1 Tax=Gracilinanus agilis TaxID=191870 RepID=UPI001CFD1779|nr:sclerostin domain-containing protein 1 [Gracilinanus agilis]
MAVHRLQEQELSSSVQETPPRLASPSSDSSSPLAACQRCQAFPNTGLWINLWNVGPGDSLNCEPEKMKGSQREFTNRVQVGCRELRSTKYISDGQCTSINPLKELVCAGECLPLPVLPNWIGGSFGTKYWSRRSSQEWRCVNDKTRTQRIQLQCQDGSTRTYKITVVTACKCKRYTRQHNESSHNYESMSPAKPASHHKERKRASKASKHSLS